MRVNLVCAAGALLALSACSGEKPASADADATTAAASPPAAAATAAASHAAAPSAPAPAVVDCTDFRSDLEEGDMIRIYYAVAGLPPPREKWAERILPRVDNSLPPEEAWNRAMAEVDARWNALKDVRCITLNADSGIRRYDAARGGLLVEAFSPSSYYNFGDYADRVRLKIRNADAAYLWKMPPERGQALTANYNMSGSSVVARLKIVGARPSQDGGIIEAEVIDYDFVPRAGSRAATETVKVEG